MSKKPRTGFEELARESRLYPQEALLKVRNEEKSLFIGIPHEISYQEKRVALTPGGVEVLVANGHNVWVETGAGRYSKFSDAQYSEAGARIVYSHEEVFEADIIVKIEPPTLEEIEFLKPGKTVISALQMGNVSREYIVGLTQKKATCLAFEFIEDKVGGMPAVRAMSEIAGICAISIASEYLRTEKNGMGVILGGISGVPPTKVVIIGAGTVAEFAVRAALGLGAEIKVFDNHIYKLRRLKHNLGTQLYTSSLDLNNLRDALKTADVVIGAKRVEKGRSRFLVSEEMVGQMKDGAVIIDVSIDQGGGFETSEITTHDQPVYEKFGVIHYCVPNIASMVPKSATTALNNIFTPILLQMGEIGGVEEMIYCNKWFARGVYSYRGSLCNMQIGRKLDLEYKDIELILAARI
jgi:alanine dehydrogenase